MSIIQSFYNNLAPQYDKLFLDWQATTKEQAIILDKIFKDSGFDKNSKVLDCACGIGTQAIGLAKVGYNITASDISEEEIIEAKKRALENNVEIDFKYANFCYLSEVFSKQFDIIIAMDNALPHMLSKSELEKAIKSITNQIKEDGIFVASIRDYDELVKDKPPYSPAYIHKNDKGQRVCFQTWDWQGENYKLIQYIIEDGDNLEISKFECEYRMVLREEITNLLFNEGCKTVEWKFPKDTGFYQPIVVARK